MKIRCLMTILAITALIGCSQQNRKNDVPLDVALQTAMDESLENSGAIGVSAAVVFPDGNMWKGASGLSHEDVPVTTEMLFDIGSVQKNFQAVLCLTLVKEGLLSLDDPLEKWFPPHPNIDGKITIRQLLNMTSGIDKFVDDSNSPFKIGYRNIRFEEMYTWEEIYKNHIGESNFKPGTKCEYSTTNYIILRHIIERASQSKQTALFEERLLKPYNLNHTLADFTRPIPESMQIAHGWLYVGGDGDPEDISGNSLNWIASLSPMLVYSTPGDMAAWMHTLFHKKNSAEPGDSGSDARILRSRTE
jgi:D-alanyl-D-alanine carboxypeptidase